MSSAWPATPVTISRFSTGARRWRSITPSDWPHPLSGLCYTPATACVLTTFAVVVLGRFGSDGMGGQPFEQQIRYCVGLLVEDPVRDAFEDLKPVLGVNVIPGRLGAFLKQGYVAVAPDEHRWDSDLFAKSPWVVQRERPIPVECAGQRTRLSHRLGLTFRQCECVWGSGLHKSGHRERPLAAQHVPLGNAGQLEEVDVPRCESLPARCHRLEQRRGVRHR